MSMKSLVVDWAVITSEFSLVMLGSQVTAMSGVSGFVVLAVLNAVAKSDSSSP